MSCACENLRYGAEKERIRRLAKSLAELSDQLVGIYENKDGTYGFEVLNEESPDKYIEIVTPY